MKYKYRTKPFLHQHKAVLRALRQHHIGLLWDPGVAKTKPVIDWAGCLYMKEDLRYMLVAAPLSVLGVWYDEFELHSPLWEWGDVNFITFDKNTDTIPVSKKKLNVLVVNYDLIWRRDDVGPLKHYLKRLEMAVADESHLIKKPSAERTKAMHRLKQVPYRAILTGTVAPRSYRDLYAQWKFLNNTRFPSRVSDYEHRYIVYSGYMGKQVKGYLNVKELKRKIRADASIKRKENCLDLPPERFQRVPFDLEPAVMKQYQKLAMEFFLELETGEVVDAKNAAVKMLRLQQLTGGFIGTEEGVRQISKAKLSILRDLFITRKEHGDKAVVFARFIPEIHAIRKVGLALKVPTFVLYGDIKPEERDKARRRFQKMRGPAFFVSQTESGGLGITLHSANEAFFYSPSYRLDSWIQDRGRIHRSGQKRAVTHRLLVARGTVDNLVYQGLRHKEDALENLLANPKLLLDTMKEAA